MSLLDHVRKMVVDEAKGTVTDTRPLYAAAGVVDYVVGFARTIPGKLEGAAEQVQAEWTAERFGEAFSDLVDGANTATIRARSEEVRERVAETLKDRRDAVVDDLADLSAEARNLPAQVRDRARQAPGRAVVGIANQVGAAYELYDTVVDRGRVAVARLRGDATPGSTPSPANRVPGATTGDLVAPVTRPRPSAVTPPIVTPPGVPPVTRPVPAVSAPASGTGVPSPSSVPSTAPLRRPRPASPTPAATTPAGSPTVRRPRKTTAKAAARETSRIPGPSSTTAAGTAATSPVARARRRLDAVDGTDLPAATTAATTTGATTPVAPRKRAARRTTPPAA